ncbi:MAG: hypothetical protein ACK4SX_12890 [Alcanivoracaceae bacterium]
MINTVSFISSIALLGAILYFWRMVKFIAAPCSESVSKKLRHSINIIVVGSVSVGFGASFFQDEPIRALIVPLWSIVCAVCLIILANALVSAVHEALNVNPSDLGDDKL